MMSVLGKFHFEIADYWFELGVVLQKQATAAAAAGGDGDERGVAKLRQQRRQALSKALKIREVCCGAEHPRTLLARAELESAD